MKVIWIPHHDCSPSYFCNEVGGRVGTLTTNLQILWLCRVENQELCWWAWMQQPVSHYGDTNWYILSSFLHNTQHNFSIWHIGTYSASCISPDNLFSSAQISIIGRGSRSVWLYWQGSISVLINRECWISLCALCRCEEKMKLLDLVVWICFSELSWAN
jgi:hypothetical protein